MYIYGIQKDGTDEPICRAAVETNMEKRLVDTEGEGQGGTNGENSTETYTLPYVIQIASEIYCMTQGAQISAL